MNKMKITFLGTGDAIPTEKRNHTAILISVNDENILIDCGEGTQRQFRLAHLNPCKLTRLLISHWHGDHTLGIPGLLQTLSSSGYNKTLHINGPAGTHEKLSLIRKLFGEISIQLNVQESTGKIFENKDMLISSAPMMHGTKTEAYSIELKGKLRINKEKLKKLGIPPSPLIKKLQEGKSITHNNKKITPEDVAFLEKGKKISIILDTLPNSNILEIAKNSDIFICDSTFLDEDNSKAEEHKHLTAKQAAKIAKQAKVKELILTHFSQRYSKNPDAVLKEAKSIFKNTKMASDFDEITI